MWIMWISRCITRKCRKTDKKSMWITLGKTLWISVDNVDVHKIEHTFVQDVWFTIIWGNVNFYEVVE